MVEAEVAIERMRQLLGRLIARRNVRHAVVGIADMAGTWSWSEVLGDATPDGVPMRPSTPWHLASVTKLYIATVVLRLHERGLIALDEPIAAPRPDAHVAPERPGRPAWR